MCVVSMVLDWGRGMEDDYWTTPGRWTGFKKVVDQAREFDRVTEQPPCDPAKEAWYKSIEERLAGIERALEALAKEHQYAGGHQAPDEANAEPSTSK